MAKKSPAKRIAHLESVVIGAGFLLRKLQHTYGASFGVGMDEQVRNCIRDCIQIERNQLQRAAAAAQKAPV